MPPRKSLSARAAERALANLAPPSPVVLVGCGKAKADRESAARSLYTGHLFRASWEYASAVAEAEGGRRFILSAKHHLLSPWTWVEPYDLALADLSADERRAWGVVVASQISNVVPLRRGSRRLPRIIAFAGRAYVDAVQHGLDDRLGAGALVVEAPMAGLGIGQRRAWLAERLAEIHADSPLPY